MIHTVAVTVRNVKNVIPPAAGNLWVLITIKIPISLYTGTIKTWIARAVIKRTHIRLKLNRAVSLATNMMIHIKVVLVKNVRAATMNSLGTNTASITTKKQNSNYAANMPKVLVPAAIKNIFIK